MSFAVPQGFQFSKVHFLLFILECLFDLLAEQVLLHVNNRLPTSELHPFHMALKVLIQSVLGWQCGFSERQLLRNLHISLLDYLLLALPQTLVQGLLRLPLHDYHSIRVIQFSKGLLRRRKVAQGLQRLQVQQLLLLQRLHRFLPSSHG